MEIFWFVVCMYMEALLYVKEQFTKHIFYRLRTNLISKSSIWNKISKQIDIKVFRLKQNFKTIRYKFSSETKFQNNLIQVFLFAYCLIQSCSPFEHKITWLCTLKQRHCTCYNTEFSRQSEDPKSTYQISLFDPSSRKQKRRNDSQRPPSLSLIFCV